ncbi:MAG: YbaN family protein [Thermoflexales bacterium]|nr:YbaN family protein [Thermoflexales bacterium]
MLRAWIERSFQALLREWQHHTNPARHRPLPIAPAASPTQRLGFFFAGVVLLSIGGVGWLTPIMPTWPFVLAALFCFARASNRLRCWLMHNRVMMSVYSLVRSRPEPVFVLARRLIHWLSGAHEGDEHAHATSCAETKKSLTALQRKVERI